MTVITGTNYCEPDALLAFTDRAEQIADSVDALLSRLAGARVARDAFGRMPFISERVFTAYDEHVDDTTDGIAEAQLAVLGAGIAVASCAAQWLQAEVGTLEDMVQVGEPE